MATLTFPSIIPASMTWSLQTRTQTFESPVSASVQTLELVGAARWAAQLDFPPLLDSDHREMMAFLAELKGMAGRFYLHNFSAPEIAGSETTTPKVNGASAAVNNGAGYAATTTSITVDTETRTFEVGEYVQFAGHDSVYELVAGTVAGTLVLETGGLDEAVVDDEVVDVYHQGTTLKIDRVTDDTAGILLPGDYFEVNDELKIVTETCTSVGDDATVTFSPPLRSSPADNSNITLSEPKAIMRLVDDGQAGHSAHIGSIYGFSFNCIEAF